MKRNPSYKREFLELVPVVPGILDGTDYRKS